MTLPALPGADLVEKGLRDLEQGTECRRVPAADVEAMRDRGLITPAEVRRQFALIEPLLYRFPATDPPSFRHAVDAMFPG